MRISVVFIDSAGFDTKGEDEGEAMQSVTMSYGA